MKHTFTILFIIATFTIAFIAGNSLDSITGFVVAETAETEENDNKEELPTFRLYTKAVCENTSDFIVCNDELFASCGGLEYRLPKNEVNGNGVFSKDWKDPRND